MNKYDRCPCRSKLLYHKCCQPYHEGKNPENALALMRSRYTAYALGLVDYIIDTTHPNNAESSADRGTKAKQISSFCTDTRFDGARILDFVDGEQEATVKFVAYLRQHDVDVSFTERSLFEKVNGRWLYKCGDVEAGDST